MLKSFKPQRVHHYTHIDNISTLTQTLSEGIYEGVTVFAGGQRKHIIVC